MDEEKNERELKMELDRAEQRTVHYEELTVRIALLEKHLAAVKARGDQVFLRFVRLIELTRFRLRSEETSTKNFSKNNSLFKNNVNLRS